MFRCYRQLESSDCGLTCIRMIARHYGQKIPMRHLRDSSDLNRLGMSIKDIVDTAEKSGMDSIAVRISTSHFDNMPLPAILYWQQQHFVVLYKYNADRKKFHIADPAQGKLTYDESDFHSYWIPEGDDKGLAILMEPNESFTSRQYPEEYVIGDFMSYLFGLFKKYRLKFLTSILITIFIMASDLALPLLIKKTVDEGIALNDINLVVALLAGQLSFVLAGLVASNCIDLILTKTGLSIHLNMVKTYLEKLSKLPISYFDTRISSDFIQKISDQDRIKDFLVSFPNSIFVTFLTLIVFSFLLFHFSPLIFAIFILLSFIEIFWNVSFLNRRKTLDYAYFTHSSANTNHAFELTKGMADLKVNNAENTRIEKWKKTQECMNSVSVKSTWLNIAQNGGVNALSGIKNLVVTAIGSLMVISGDLSLGALMTLGYITGRLATPFTTIGSSISSLQQAIISYQRIAEVVTDKAENRGTRKYSTSSVILKDVSFKYAGTNSPFVIKNMSLTIEAGKTTALVGESGSGKSTLIKLMLGFYKPQEGSLELSGVDVSEIDNQDWLSHCGVVMQEARIFSGSILENVSLSDSKPDISKVVKLLEIVGLTEFVDSLPMGIHTKIGTSGIEMSGGQKQRVVIARALYKDPDLLFLDEATSSLDANNEKNIVNQIKAGFKGKTIVVAAHRLSTIRNADKIIFLKNGKVAEIGTHDELLANKKDYWKLVRNQLHLLHEDYMN